MAAAAAAAAAGVCLLPRPTDPLCARCSPAPVTAAGRRPLPDLQRQGPDDQAVGHAVGGRGRGQGRWVLVGGQVDACMRVGRDAAGVAGALVAPGLADPATPCSSPMLQHDDRREGGRCRQPRGSHLWRALGLPLDGGEGLRLGGRGGRWSGAAMRLGSGRCRLTSAQQACAAAHQRPPLPALHRPTQYPATGRVVQHPHCGAVQTYRGHSVLSTLIRWVGAGRAAAPGSSDRPGSSGRLASCCARLETRLHPRWPAPRPTHSRPPPPCPAQRLLVPRRHHWPALHLLGLLRRPRAHLRCGRGCRVAAGGVAAVATAACSVGQQLQEWLLAGCRRTAATGPIECLSCSLPGSGSQLPPTGTP